VVVGDLGPDTDWHAALHGCDAVVHLAARVHVMHDAVGDVLGEYRRANTAGTARLAELAHAARVRRFVFVSTAKVLGEASPSGRPFTDDDPPAPSGPYALSKAQAERALERLAEDGTMRVVSVRPPLVYGPGVGANFLRLMHTVARGWPLPLGAIANRRSMVYVGNLADAIAAVLENPNASGPCLVSDGEDVSTPELVRRVAAALDRPARLIPVPPALFFAAGALLGRRADVERLLGDFAVVPTRLISLGWRPPYSLAQGLVATVDWFRSRRD
jgi:nucleoside-diphosphate-sugar epimerase